MTYLWKGDFENEKFANAEQFGIADRRLYNNPSWNGRVWQLSCDGKKWSTAVSYQGWTARIPLNETVGTTADDTLGSHDGTYTGGFTLNQVSNVSESGTHSVLFNGSTGWVNLGANGFDLTSGSWAFFCLVFPQALGAAQRGLFGGPTGSYCLSLFNGELFIGVVGGGQQQLPTYSRPAKLNDWNAIAVSYDAPTNRFRRWVEPISNIEVGTSYANVENLWTEDFRTITPTPGVKSNQLMRRDAGGYFQGFAQECLFLLGSSIDRNDFEALAELARTQATDKATGLQVDGDAGPTKKGFGRIQVPPSAGTSLRYSAGEFTIDSGKYVATIGQTHYLSWAARFPSDSNWNGDFWGPPGSNNWHAMMELCYGLNSGSIFIAGYAKNRDGNAPVVSSSDAGVATPQLRFYFAGGATAQDYVGYPVADPEDHNYINPNAGNGWDTHYPPGTQGGGLSIRRWPQILGPRPFLGGSHPFTFDVWHEFIFKFRYSTNAWNGTVEVWHRERGAGATWGKVYEVGTNVNAKIGPGRNIVQWSTVRNDPATGPNGYHKAALSYIGDSTLDLYWYVDQLSFSDSFADADAMFASETPAANVDLEQNSFRAKNDTPVVGPGLGESATDWRAAENTDWSQQPNTNIRVRFGMQATGGTSGATGVSQLQYSRNGGAFTNVTATSSVVRTSGSPHVADNASTTKQLTTETGPFTPGTFDEVDGAVPTVTLSAGGHTEHELCFQIVGADVLDGDVIQLRLTAANDSSILYSRIPQITVTGGTAPPPDAYRSLVRGMSGLRAYYRLDDVDATLRDDLGVLNGSYIGTTTKSQPGIAGTAAPTAVDFDGTTGYASVADNALLDLGNGPLSIVAWVKRDSTGSLDVIASKGTGAYSFSLGTDNKLHFGLTNSTDIVASSTTLTDTVNWHMVAVTYTSGTTVNLYIDGTDVTGTPASQTLADNAQAFTLAAHIA